MLLLKCITLCLGTVHLLSRVTWSQRGGALTGLQPCAWTCLDMSGHSQNGRYVQGAASGSAESRTRSVSARGAGSGEPESGVGQLTLTDVS